MTDQSDSSEHRTVRAEPYTARQCPECDTWVYVDDGPFAENDPTKTVADWRHWERLHLYEADQGDAIGFPYFNFNETPVEAMIERWEGEPTRGDAHRATSKTAISEALDRLQRRADSAPPSIGD